MIMYGMGGDSNRIGDIKYTYVIEDGWIELNGQLVNRSEYSLLFNWAEQNNLIISESDWTKGYTSNRSNMGLFSYGDGSTTFRLPDFRARFIRGLDNDAGIDPNRILGTEELASLVMGGDDNAAGFDIFNLYNHSSDTGSILSGDALSIDTIQDYDIYQTGNRDYLGRYILNIINILGTNKGNSMDGYVVSRPRNIALHAVMKYK